MKHSDFLATWGKIKDRFPNWNPTQTEAEDFCLGLNGYDFDLVEEVGQWIVKTYSSNIPKLAWYIKECEKRKKELKRMNVPERIIESFDVEEYEAQKEQIIQRLEGVPTDQLRKAYQSVMKKVGHLISKPEDGNVREWKQTLRSQVHIELFGKQD